MIVIDMDMPKTCDECVFFDGEDMCYADGTFALSQSAFENRPKWCPIKCDIEDIKEDIKQEIVDIVREESSEGKPKWCAGLGYSLKIIDKYIRGAE